MAFSRSDPESRMADEPLAASLDRELTASIVVAYVRRNEIGADQLATLISTGHRALPSLGKPPPEIEVERTPLSRSVDRSTPIMWFASNAAGAA